MIKLAAFLFIIIALAMTWPVWGGLLFIFGPLIPAMLVTIVLLPLAWALTHPKLALECAVAFWDGLTGKRTC